jgi:1-acyl-sn-glycerol-3-phosphate acyltransferase
LLEQSPRRTARHYGGRVRDLTYRPLTVAVAAAFRLLRLRVDVTGSEHVPTTGGAVLALNHVSYVDFVLAGIATQPSRRKVRFLAKRELFSSRLTGPLMRSLHHIEVDRTAGSGSFDEAVRYLVAGELVGVFPEATISRSFELKQFKTGAVRLAAAAGVPLVPAVLWGTQRMVTKDRPRDLSRGQTVAVHVGAPLHPTGADVVAETAELRERMGTLLDRAIRTYPERPEGAWWLPASYGGTAPSPEEAERLDAEERRRRAEAAERRRS